MRPGKVILLNGTSSAGKTTLARAVQDESATPVVYWGIDVLFGLVPPNWGAGRGGRHSRDGFWYDRSGRDEDGHPLQVVRYGDVGHRILRSGCAAAAAFARGGNDVVVDEMLLAPELMSAWTTALAGLDVTLVRVDCPLAVAEERERARGIPAGLARGHLRTVHDHGVPYDLVVDTTEGTPATLARTVIRA